MDNDRFVTLAVSLLSQTDVLLWILSAIGTLVTALLATKTGKEIAAWWDERKQKQFGEALNFIQAGVIEVYHTLYTELKTTPEKRITKVEAARLRNAAIKAAIQLSVDAKGKDIVTPSIGAGLLNNAVESAVDKVKARSNLPTQPR